MQNAAAARHDAQEFEPKVVAFLCKWCSSAGSDLAGVSRLKYPANAVPIQVMCSGSVSPIYILSAFNKGADGVLVSGCHPGDCHYLKGNYYARRRLFLVQKLLQFVGVEADRFRMSWVSAAEGAKFAEVITDFVNDLKALGPQTKLKANR
ncbi:hydrogenase iron-sulfur subunit [Blastochloris tepida]|uniref:hydrogenase iron-sulfur subunit n=1 Tax=Blastochloris tepida TaxID=2233851 RepID=UPI000F84334F|nr:hydrogenase iron-sulfur subunit [Blastochloris tepida]